MTTSIGITYYKRLTLAIEDQTDLLLTWLTDWPVPLLSLADPSFGRRQAPWEVVDVLCDARQGSNMLDVPMFVMDVSEELPAKLYNQVKADLIPTLSITLFHIFFLYSQNHFQLSTTFEKRLIHLRLLLLLLFLLLFL